MSATHLAAVRDATAYLMLVVSLVLLALGTVVLLANCVGRLSKCVGLLAKCVGLLANWMERRVSPGTDRQEHVGEKRDR